MFIYNWSSSCICYFITADFPPSLIYFIFTPWTTHSTYFYFRGLVQSTSLCSRTRSISKDKRIIVWVVAPLGTRTSLPTSWSDYSMLTSTQAFTSPPIRLLVASASSIATLGTCQLCWGLLDAWILHTRVASWARDSLGVWILLRLIAMLSSYSMLFRSECWSWTTLLGSW